MNNLHRLNMYKRFIRLGDKIDVFVVRLSKTGSLGFSRPCRNCLLRFTKSPYQINNIYYSCDPDTIHCEKFKYMIDSPLTKMSSADRIKKSGKAKKSEKAQSLTSSKISSSESDTDQSTSTSPKRKHKNIHKRQYINSRKN
jgi:hypothetical protein